MSTINETDAIAIAKLFKYPPESKLTWAGYESRNGYEPRLYLVPTKELLKSGYTIGFPAYDMEELMNMLPDAVEIEGMGYYSLQLQKDCSGVCGCYRARYYHKNYGEPMFMDKDKNKWNDNPCISLAWILIELLKNNYEIDRR
jgi:hypothetical protein